VNYQVNWKVDSPYAKRRGFAGLDGLIALYREYCSLTDQLYADLDIPKITIETSRQEWGIYDDIIDRALMSVDNGSNLRADVSNLGRSGSTRVLAGLPICVDCRLGFGHWRMP
jgi:hypothetical protein